MPAKDVEILGAFVRDIIVRKDRTPNLFISFEEGEVVSLNITFRDEEMEVWADKAVEGCVTPDDFNKNFQWLRENSVDYAGLWVALKDGVLLGNDESRARLRSALAGMLKDVLFFKVEDGGSYEYKCLHPNARRTLEIGSRKFWRCPDCGAEGEEKCPSI